MVALPNPLGFPSPFSFEYVYLNPPRIKAQSDVQTMKQSVSLSFESKACNLQECKGKGLENSNAIGDTDVFPVVRIGGAILHPR